MSSQLYAIENIIFDIDFFSKEKAYDLQNRISRLFNQHLSGQMQQVFSKTVPADTLIRGEHVLLDIGTVSYENLEKEISAKLEEALFRFLSSFLLPDGAKPDDAAGRLSVVPLQSSYLSVFEQFLLTGVLPAYNATGGTGELEKNIDALFTGMPAKLSATLLSAGGVERVRRRIVYQFSEAFIRKVVQLLEPDEAPFIITYKDNVNRMHRKAPVVTSDAQSFHKELWVFILTFLMVDKGSLFSRKAFARSTFKRIAAHFNIAYSELLRLLQESLITGNIEANKSELITLIHILTTEETSSYQSVPADMKGKKEAQADDLPATFDIEAENDLLSEAAAQIIHKPEAKNALPGDAENVRVTLADPITYLIAEGKNVLLETGESATAELMTNEERSKQQSTKAISQQVWWLIHYLLHGSLPVEAILNRSQYRDLFFAALQSHPQLIQRIISRLPSSVIYKRSVQTGIDLAAEIVAVHHSLQEEDTEASLYQFPGVLHDAPDDEPGKPSARFYEDLLYHFIRTGFLPWWASQQPVPLQNLLEELYTASPQKAVQVLKWAGQEEAYRSRFISRFSFAVVTKIIVWLPDGKEAVAALEQMSFLFPEDSRSDKMPKLLNLVWEEYILHQYQRFQPTFFVMQAVKEVVAYYSIAPEITRMHLTELLTKKDINGLQALIQAYAKNGKQNQSRLSLSSSFVPEEDVIMIVLLGVAVVQQLPVVQPEQAGDTGGLANALVHYIRYFFEHGALPAEAAGKLSASPLLFCKTALLLLYNTAEAEAEKLVSSYYRKANIEQRIIPLFTATDYREKAVRLWLNRLAVRYSGNDNSEQNSTILSAPVPLTKEENRRLGELPVIQNHYIIGVFTNAERAEKIKNIIQHFLTWQILPAVEKSITKQNVDAILTEAVFFLFAENRNLLLSLMRRQTSLPAAVVRIAGLFTAAKGGAEALLVHFLQPSVDEAVIEYVYEEADETAIHESGTEMTQGYIPTNVLSSLRDADVKDIGHENEEKEAVAWLDYFLTYNKLPTALSEYREEEAVLTLLLFLVRRNKSLLPELLRKETHHVVARMKIHEWLQSHSPERRVVVAMTKEALHRDMLRYLHQSAGVSLKGIENSLTGIWKSGLSSQQKHLVAEAIARYAPVREEWLKTASLPDVCHVLKEKNAAMAKQYLYFINAITKLVLPVLQQGYERDTFALQCKAYLLMIATGEITVSQPSDFIRRFFFYLDKRKPSFVPQLYNDLRDSWEHITETVAIEPAVRREFQNVIADRLSSPHLWADSPKQANKKKGQASVYQEQKVPSATGKGRTNDGEKISREDTPKQQPPMIETGTKLYVPNAGLVLLHPFIPTYFMLTGLMDKGQFPDEEAQRRAALLLQYAVFETTEYEEPALVLNKLLCGLPVEEPVPAWLLPTEKERQVTAELFTIIFQRWERMKNATADNFRHSFLQREGILTKGEKAWKMRIDQRGYDMLLQTLPWAFGVVKFPWMPLPVETEWI